MSRNDESRSNCCCGAEAVRIDSRCGARSLLLRFPRPKRKRIAIAALERMVRKMKRLYGAERAVAEQWLRARGWRVDAATATVWRWIQPRYPAARWKLEDALELLRYQPERTVQGKQQQL